MVKLDSINVRILRELRKNARLPNTQLADRIGLSPPACLRRVQEMERSGVITGYHASIDRSILGRTFVAYAAVSLSDHSQASLRRFEDIASALPEVVECHKIAGSIEFLLRVEVKDAKAYDCFHVEKLSNIRHVFEIKTNVVISSNIEETTGTLTLI